MTRDKDTNPLEELRIHMKLFRGSVKRTAEKADCTTFWVYQVVNGNAQSEKVIEAALSVLAEMKKEREEQRTNKHANISKRLQAISS